MNSYLDFRYVTPDGLDAFSDMATVDPGDSLERNDSFPLFEALDDLIVSGPTGTNVADIQILLLA